jgi:hypothetical protein
MNANTNNPLRPFVIIEPYQYEGDVAFGMWDDGLKRYRLGDGDCYDVEELERSWAGEYTLLTWGELEQRLRGPNTPYQPDALIVAFVQGAQWWEFHKTGATMWASDRNNAERQAKTMANNGTLGKSPNYQGEAQPPAKKL